MNEYFKYAYWYRKYTTRTYEYCIAVCLIGLLQASIFCGTLLCVDSDHKTIKNNIHSSANVKMHLKSFLHLLQIATILSLYDVVIGDVSILSSASQDQDSVPALRANKLRSFVSENKKNKKSKKGNNDSSFDLYVFSMSYQPEFCYQNRNRSYNGCENPIDFWRGSLTIHGLWPEVRVLSF